jgi:glycosyltransferase involved in cell wall biosynthesis
MRIAYIFNHADIVGGGVLSFLDLVRSIRRFGVDPLAFVPAKGAVAERLRGMDVGVRESPQPAIHLKTLAGFNGIAGAFARAFRESGISAVHANGARCMLYAGLAARRAGVPCVWHVRVLERDRVLDRVRAFLSDRIIANSKAVAGKLKYYSFKPAKISMISNGIDIEDLSKAPVVDIRREFGLSGAPVILAVGRLSPEKGYDTLIRACAVLNKKGVDFTCLIAGQAPTEHQAYVESLMNLAEQLGVRNVRFTGWRNDAAGIMKSCALLALPSLRESFGRTIVESWACGLPVVAPASGGPAALIVHGENGLLARPADPQGLAKEIEKLLSDGKLRRRLVDAGGQSAGGFTLERHAREVFNVYEGLLRK